MVRQIRISQQIKIDYKCKDVCINFFYSLCYLTQWVIKENEYKAQGVPFFCKNILFYYCVRLIWRCFAPLGAIASIFSHDGHTHGLNLVTGDD